MHNNSVPPGFAPRTSFTLKRVERIEEGNSSNGVVNDSRQEPVQMDIASHLTDLEKVKTSLKHRPWILFGQRDHISVVSDSELIDMESPSKTHIPKGVTHGCPDCSDCVKVTGTWLPKDAEIEVLEEAPVFYPTEEEFKDTLQYVASIRARAEQYGICRIHPPPSWKPPSLIEKNSIWKGSTFVSLIQQIHGLRRQCSHSKLDGSDESIRKKRRMLSVSSDNRVESTSSPGESERGPEFTLDSFKRHADDFLHQYFHKSEDRGDQEQWKTPSVENIEAEYKRIIENPTEEMEVLCGNNLESKAFGSGFPTLSDDSNSTSSYAEYLTTGWNLNNLPRLPCSLLSFENHVTCDILASQICVGMCFSSSLWKIEEHHLYSLNYLHLGAPKVWYGVPGKSRINFESATKTYFPDSSEHPELHHRLVQQLSPATMKSEGTPVFRCIQCPGEFVLVLPGAYHSSFDCGFNVSERARFAPVDWLPHGQNAIELYSEQRRKTSISYDKLLLGAARAAIRAQWEISLLKKNTTANLFWNDAIFKGGILTEAFKSRLNSEDNQRKYLCTKLKSEKMNSDFDASRKRECSICFCDLHFSAIGCPCSVDKFSCLLHAKQLCSCAWNDRIFLYRHHINDLRLLLEALEGKLSAVIRWAKNDLGLYLHEHLPKTNAQSSQQVDGCGSLADKIKLKEHLCGVVSSAINSTSRPAELKARMMQSTIKNILSADRNLLGSLIDDTKSATSSIRAELKARLLQSSISKTLKSNDNSKVSIETSTANSNDINSSGTVDEHKGVCTQQQPMSTEETYVLPIEVASGVSSVTSSESSSSGSMDLVPHLLSLTADHEAESRAPQAVIHVLSDDSDGQ